jgi:hypothetical protein
MDDIQHLFETPTGYGLLSETFKAELTALAAKEPWGLGHFLNNPIVRQGLIDLAKQDYKVRSLKMSRRVFFSCTYFHNFRPRGLTISSQHISHPRTNVFMAKLPKISFSGRKSFLWVKYGSF